MLNEDGKMTTPFKLEICTKPSASHLRVLFCSCVVHKATAHVEAKTLNMRHQAQKGFCGIYFWNSIVSKRVSCVRTKYKEDNIFI